ncbi:hypothetical protein [Vibrio paucivorans]|uniref:Uncharacterized protein n=1 Tax=Vibrio paucivorans TaxID=2829489 RepID=A0A9X3HTY8_9VIBR|nr:hypothetical protein [Vibrio paucivorans]MCW8336071.1 hypothetical protein [Vibrio paucivorans]
MKVTRTRSILLICMGAIGYWYYHDAKPKIWGDEPDEPYITIFGKKPIDANIDAWAIWGASGSQCGAKTWSADSGWSDGANVKWHITHDFSNDPSQYELRIPFQQYQDSLDCEVILGDITVQAYNAFDTVGFAQLRIYQSGTDYNDKPIDLNSTIQARKCEPFYSPKYDRWTNGFGCFYYVNGERKSKEQEFNAETVYFNFSQFSSDTVIHYDIVAGEEYRSTPLDPQTGK